MSLGTEALLFFLLYLPQAIGISSFCLVPCDCELAAEAPSNTVPLKGRNPSGGKGETFSQRGSYLLLFINIF